MRGGLVAQFFQEAAPTEVHFKITFHFLDRITMMVVSVFVVMAIGVLAGSEQAEAGATRFVPDLSTAPVSGSVSGGQVRQPRTASFLRCLSDRLELRKVVVLELLKA